MPLTVDQLYAVMPPEMLEVLRLVEVYRNYREQGMYECAESELRMLFDAAGKLEDWQGRQEGVEADREAAMQRTLDAVEQTKKGRQAGRPTLRLVEVDED